MCTATGHTRSLQADCSDEQRRRGADCTTADCWIVNENGAKSAGSASPLKETHSVSHSDGNPKWCAAPRPYSDRRVDQRTERRVHPSGTRDNPTALRPYSLVKPVETREMRAPPRGSRGRSDGAA
eukprot:500501-Prorocentrum_minimum.AAC.2